MKRIVHIIFSLEIGGAENMLVDILNEQINYARVCLIIINCKHDDELLSRISEKIRVVKINRKEGDKWNLISVLKTWTRVYLLNPGIIHCHDYKIIKLLFFWKKKCVITVHDVGIDNHYLNEYYKVFSISNAVKEDLINRYNISTPVISNGIDFSKFNVKTNYEEDLKEVKIVQVGRLVHSKKGQDLALRALSFLKKEGIQNIHLYFVGSGSSFDYLKILTNNLKLGECVHFLGPRDRTWIMQNLNTFSMLIQPSLYEGFGLTIVEGIAAGLPVAATNIDGPKEILQNLPSGFLFNKDIPEELACRIKDIMKLYEAKRIRDLCLESKRIAQSKYSIQSTAFSYFKNY